MDNSSNFVKANAAIKNKKTAEEKPVEIKLEIKKTSKAKPAVQPESIISQERLQEAIIWSEILGKPLSKRRKRREY